ncbi:MAG: efflux RND transporter periplasmic adaptor subunit [Planctomycetota bacterium]
MSKNKIYIAITSVIIILVILFASGQIFSGKGDNSANGPTYQVKRGPLTINFVESGTIKARDQIIIKNEVEGRTSIISLVPEGTRVKKGELLVQLDASSLEDDKIDQEIRVQNAEASFIGATENLAVIENQAKSDVDLAKLDFEFAKQDLEKYLKGEYPYKLDEADRDITVAKSEHAQAQQTLQWSLKLYEDRYISETEFEEDKLDEQKKKLDVQLAEKSKELLTEYTYKRDMAQLKSDLSQADMALERTERKARADVIQAKADLKAKEAEFRRQKDKLQKNKDQIKKTKIYAPADGLVIYATSAKSGGHRSSVEPLEEGKEIREREELIYLPLGNLSKAEVAIHESNLEKTQIGLPVIITVDALQGDIFYGTLQHIAPLPDAQSMYMNPDLKVYDSEVYIDGNNEILRTGMSCQAEIIIAQYQDALYVPLQAVMRVADEPTVYVQAGDLFEPRKVKTGFDNNKMIHILEGLDEGDIVLLSPPLESAAVSAEDRNALPGQASTKTMHQEISERLNNIKTTETNKKTDSPKETTSATRQRKRKSENIDPEQRKKMRERLEKMSPGEREKFRKQRQGQRKVKT